MRVNILLINHYAGSLLHGMEYRPFYLAREWVRAGHQVQIVAASFSHVLGKIHGKRLRLDVGGKVESSGADVTVACVEVPGFAEDQPDREEHEADHREHEAELGQHDAKLGVHEVSFTRPRPDLLPAGQARVRSAVLTCCPGWS